MFGHWKETPAEWYGKAAQLLDRAREADKAAMPDAAAMYRKAAATSDEIGEVLETGAGIPKRLEAKADSYENAADALKRAHEADEEKSSDVAEMYRKAGRAHENDAESLNQ